MTEAEWLMGSNPARMLDSLRGPAIQTPLPERKSRLFGLACCNRIRHLITDRRSLQALDVLTQYAEGEVALEELCDAYSDAFRAASEVVETDDTIGATQAAFAVSDACYQHELADAVAGRVRGVAFFAEMPDEVHAQVTLIRDIFGNPFRPVTSSSEWRTDTAVALARQMYESRDFSAMPILADALQDAGCDNEDILAHCRSEGPHVRGCWVVDLVLEQE